jgi:sterol desaturase/sphingolipid hydroxylase (fatty acid hydroxylase superfamily)
MSAELQQWGGLLKLGILIGGLMLLAIAQARWPRRPMAFDGQRWLRHLGLISVSTLLLRLLAPLAALVIVGTQHWGLLKQLPPMPVALEVLLSVLLLDLAIYFQHRAFHHFPYLWRAHAVHHSDTAFDVTLGIRFHPLEILPSYLFKVLVALLLGVSATALLIYEAVLLAFSLFSHANLKIPEAVERWLRKLVVTPDWHRVHHSTDHIESNHNFGNFLSIWDRLFGTAQEQPQAGHTDMQLGLLEHRSTDDQRVLALLTQPFRPD